jgi:hypothetical protein
MDFHKEIAAKCNCTLFEKMDPIVVTWVMGFYHQSTSLLCQFWMLAAKHLFACFLAAKSITKVCTGTTVLHITYRGNSEQFIRHCSVVMIIDVARIVPGSSTFPSHPLFPIFPWIVTYSHEAFQVIWQSVVKISKLCSLPLEQTLQNSSARGLMFSRSFEDFVILQTRERVHTQAVPIRLRQRRKTVQLNCCNQGKKTHATRSSLSRKPAAGRMNQWNS